MNIYRKFGIALVIFITLVVLYKLAERRKEIQITSIIQNNQNQTQNHNHHNHNESDKHEKESFTVFSTPTSEYLNVSSKYSNSMPITSATNINLPLKEFIIKASYNSPRSGYYVSNDMLKFVLSRGCRFLDIEVHGSNNGGATVDAPVVTFQGASNQILFSDVLRTIVEYGFAGPSPNPQDPLFLNIRIYKESVGNGIYNLIGMAIQNVLGNRLYVGKVDGNTILGDIMGKLILVCDQSIDPEFLQLTNYSGCASANDNNPQCYSLSKYVNVQSGSDVLRTISASILNGMLTNPPHMTSSSSGALSDVIFWRYVVPDDPESVMNSKMFPFILNYGAQIISYKFYRPDGHMTTYETFFKDQRTAFVPFSVAIPYAQKHTIL